MVDKVYMKEFQKPLKIIQLIRINAHTHTHWPNSIERGRIWNCHANWPKIWYQMNLISFQDWYDRNACGGKMMEFVYKIIIERKENTSHSDYKSMKTKKIDMCILFID